MRGLALLSALTVLQGCATQSVTSINTGGYTVTSVPVGGSGYASSVNAYVASSSAWGALAGIVLLGYAFHGPHSGVWLPGSGFEDTRPAPPMAPDRVINEQDCSKPIENPFANLRCK
jgi:hypothetical protein